MKLIKTNSLKDLKLIANWLDKDDIGMQEMSEYVKTDNWYSLLNKDSRIVYFILNDIENIGFIDLEIVANNKAYFSFYIVPQKRNMGYGQLALKQLIKKSTELGILRLIAGVSLNNKPSWKALEKVGFLPINCDDGYQYFEKFWGCLLIKKV